MKILSTKLHGIFDYVIGISMIATPFTIEHHFTLPSTCILVAGGAATLVNSVTTNYELGFARNVSMINHLRIDVFIAMMVCLLPVLFPFDFYLANLVFGTLLFASSITTRRSAFYKMFRDFTYRKFEKFPSYRTH